MTNPKQGDNRLHRKGIGMTNFSDLNDRMTAVMNELMEALLPQCSPEVQARFRTGKHDEPEHKCRWCEGHGSVFLCDSPSGHPNDPGSVEFETGCPECEGEGTVDQETHDEQQEYDESYMDTVYDQAWERYNNRYEDY